MTIILIITVFILQLCLIARMKLGAKTWLVIDVLLLGVLSVTGYLPVWLSVVLAGVWIIIAALLFITGLRVAVLSRPVYRMLKQSLPPVSQTEQEAIDAGTVGWEAELFRGQPDWRQLAEAAQPKLSEREQAFLDNEVQHYCELDDEWSVSRRKDLSEHQWQTLKADRFFTMGIPAQYGGLAFSEDAHAAVVTKLATQCISSAVTVMVPNSLGPAKLLLSYGTQAQRDYYLPRLASGEDIPCFALTSPVAGSDAGAIPDRGIVCERLVDGEKQLGLVVTLDKRYITLAPIATLIGLAFKAFDPEHLLGEVAELGITCALIPRDTPGLEIGNRHNPIDTHFQNGTIRGKDIFIPLSAIIGGQDNIGKGWRMLIESLSVGRGISLPGLSNAAAQKAVLSTAAYASIRQQFNLPIGKFEGVQEKLVDIAMISYTIDGACKLITSALANHEKPAVLSAMVKYYTTDRGRIAMSHAMDIHAGKGLILGPKNYLAKGYTAMPVAITVEGANILTRSLMIFGQGAIRCHPYLQKEMAHLAGDEATEVSAFDGLLQQHIAYSAKNMVKALVFGLSRARLAPLSYSKTDDKSFYLPADMRHYVKQINTLSATFASISDISFILFGGSLKRKEMLTGHLSDAWMGLVMASGVIKKFDDEGQQADDKLLVSYCLQQHLYETDQAIRRVLHNYPSLIGVGLAALVRPWGSQIKPVKDQLKQQIAKKMLIPRSSSSMMQRLTSACFISDNLEHPITQMLNTHNDMAVLAVMDKKIKSAQARNSGQQDADSWRQSLVNNQVLTQQEADDYARIQASIRQTIDVDEFAPEVY
ncbi:MAG: acyl-CoA dehydrogenase [Ostreibacterium sp.]